MRSYYHLIIDINLFQYSSTEIIDIYHSTYPGREHETFEQFNIDGDIDFLGQ